MPESVKEEAALKEIDSILKENGKCLQDFSSLPQPTNRSTINFDNHLILQELNYDKHAQAIEAQELVSSLNLDQYKIYVEIMSLITNDSGGFSFVYGYGGTGKTFLWKSLISSVRARGEIVLPVASSGIAATLLPSGRTAHSRFAIPIQISESSICSISRNSSLAELLIATKLIIWDEAPMVQRFCIEAFDRTLRDIMHCDRPFGGKCVVMGGDFRQILPVIPRGSRAHIIDACINSSFLWDHCKVYTLNQNMCLTLGSHNVEHEDLISFSKWILAVGDGEIGDSIDGINEIDIPSELLIQHSGDAISAIVQSTYPSLISHIEDNNYFNERAILAPTLNVVSQINDYMCSLLPGDEFIFSSSDSFCKSDEDSDIDDAFCDIEFLNSLSCSGLPPHRLILKVGVPIMLLRNIDQSNGLCNGTRLRITHLGKSVIGAITLNGSHPNQKVLIPRINMNPSDNRWPFHMQRRQFPVTISFAMTVNKSQGQSLQQVGLYLSKPVFSHGQLYVALSRVRSKAGLKIVIPHSDTSEFNKTLNVVFKEVFRNVTT